MLIVCLIWMGLICALQKTGQTCFEECKTQWLNQTKAWCFLLTVSRWPTLMWKVIYSIIWYPLPMRHILWMPQREIHDTWQENNSAYINTGEGFTNKTAAFDPPLLCHCSATLAWICWMHINNCHHRHPRCHSRLRHLWLKPEGATWKAC